MRHIQELPQKCGEVGKRLFTLKMLKLLPQASGRDSGLTSGKDGMGATAQTTGHPV